MIICLGDLESEAPVDTTKGRQDAEDEDPRARDSL